MGERPGGELRRRLQVALDGLATGGAPPGDLELLLLKTDHVLRSQDQRIQAMHEALLSHLDDLQLRLDQLAQTRELVAFLSANLDSNELLDRLPALLAGVFAAERASLHLLDKETGLLELVGACGAPPVGKPVVRAIPIDRGIAGWVVRKGRSRLVPDLGREPLYLAWPWREECESAHVDSATGSVDPPAPGGSLLCVPLVYGGHVSGVINLSHSEVDQLDEEDESLLNLLAGPIALAVGRSRLEQSYRGRLAEQTRELSDLRDFFQSIINSSDDLIVVLSPEFEMILISTVLESLLGLTVPALINRHIDGLLLDAASSADLQNVLRQKESIRDQDVLLHHAGGQEVHASMNASPIQGRGGEVLGYLCIFRSIERRVRIHHELTRLNGRLNSLFEAAVDLGSSLDLNQVLERSLDWIHRLIEADEAALFLLSADGRFLSRVGTGDTEPSEPQPLNDCPEGIVVRQQKPLLLAEPASVRQFLPESGGRLQSCMMVPLKVQDNVLGVLRVDSRNPERLFSYQDLRLCSTFTTHAALAIENSRLYSATRRESSRLRGLLELSRRIRDLRTSQAILIQFAQTALDLAGVQAVVAWEYRKTEHQLRRACMFSRGLTLEPGDAAIPASLPGDDPLPFLLGNRERRLRFKPLPVQLPPWMPAVREREEAVSLLAVPVVDGTEVYGLMLFYGDEWHTPLEEDESFISVLALQAAAAMHSQRLLQENQTAREFLASVVASATDAIVVTDRLGRITLFNPGAEAMLGMSAEEMVGRHAPGLYPHAVNILHDLRRAMRRGQDHLTLETELTARHGRVIPVQLSLSWMRDARNRITGVLGVAKDIGEFKKLELARLEAERLSGIERMAVTVSDKINTPLSLILAQLDMVRLVEEKLSQQSEASLQSIEDQVVVIKSILDQLNTLKHPRIKPYALPNVHMYDLEVQERTRPDEQAVDPPGASAGTEAPPTREGAAGEGESLLRARGRAQRRKAPHARGRPDT